MPIPGQDEVIHEMIFGKGVPFKRLKKRTFQKKCTKGENYD